MTKPADLCQAHGDAHRAIDRIVEASDWTGAKEARELLRTIRRKLDEADRLLERRLR